MAKPWEKKREQLLARFFADWDCWVMERYDAEETESRVEKNGESAKKAQLPKKNHHRGSNGKKRR